jgi:hypothetical protein
MTADLSVKFSKTFIEILQLPWIKESWWRSRCSGRAHRYGLKGRRVVVLQSILTDPRTRIFFASYSRVRAATHFRFIVSKYIHIYIYIFVCVCVCLLAYVRVCNLKPCLLRLPWRNFILAKLRACVESVSFAKECCCSFRWRSSETRCSVQDNVQGRGDASL